MKKGDAVGMGEPLRIMSGPWSGLVGSVVALSPTRAKLEIRGCFKGEVIDKCSWFPLSNLGRNHG